LKTTDKNPEQIVAAVRRAGIVGAGGGGFPTYFKFGAKAQTVIANGSECEPLLTSDRTMMVKNPDLVIAGLKAAMAATGASNGIIGVKEHYHDAVHALSKELPKDGSIKLHLLDNYYPAGDEFLLVYEAMGRVIPEGGIPIEVGVVVNNVITLIQVAESLSGKPVVERAVTLAGEFKNPQIVTVPIGTTYQDLIKIAGGFTQKDVVLIDGGPMMGKLVNNWQAGIGKTTSGVLALPKDHFIVRMAERPLPQMIRQSKAACCQCMRCSDLCPRNLLGHNLFPHLTMRTIDYNQSSPTDLITSAYLCSQCGVCELLACDFMLLSPRQLFAAYRKELVKKGMKNPHRRIIHKPRETFAYSKLTIPTLMKKLDLEKYDLKFSYQGTKNVSLVRIALNKHAGFPAKTLVSVGKKVKMCDPIAASDADKLGSVYHASIEGKVTDITNDWIEISN
jgi:Na+-translocating ferredoxin:NAD+ oxidoreductase RnfC subunit